MKIGFFTDNYPFTGPADPSPPGGIGTYTQTVAEALAAAGHVVHVFALAHVPAVGRLVHNGVVLWQCPLWSGRREMPRPVALAFTLWHRADAQKLMRFTLSLAVRRAVRERAWSDDGRGEGVGVEVCGLRGTVAGDPDPGRGAQVNGGRTGGGGGAGAGGAGGVGGGGVRSDGGGDGGGGRFDLLESPEFGALGDLSSGRRFTRRLAVRLHLPSGLAAGGRPFGAAMDQAERALALRADVITAPTRAALSAVEQFWGIKLPAARVVPNPVRVGSSRRCAAEGTAATGSSGSPGRTVAAPLAATQAKRQTPKGTKMAVPKATQTAAPTATEIGCATHKAAGRTLDKAFGMAAEATPATSDDEVARWDVVFFGRLEPRKGIDTLAKAVAILSEHGRQVAVRFIGKDVAFDATRPGSAVIKELLAGCGAPLEVLPPVRHPGLADLVRGGRVCVLPSRTETFGLCAIEAMAWGSACVLSDIPAFAEVAGDPPAAALVQVDDPPALAAAIARLLDSPARRAALRSAGLARARAFDVSRVLPQLLDAWGVAD